jgi:membrane protein YdbS with pleckstrin-like domain
MRKALRVFGWVCVALVALMAIAIWWGQDADGLIKVITFGAAAIGLYFLITDLFVNPLKTELREISTKLDALERRLRR